MQKSDNKVPLCTNELFGDLFQECGVPVHFSLEADNDDTIISHAVFRGAAVLSADRDMFRYKGAQVQVFSKFKCNKRGFKLIPQTTTTAKKGVVPRDVLVPPPATATRHSDFVSLATFEYRRCSSSPLTKLLGNLHVTIRPLRQALYHHMGLTQSVYEELPVWNEQDQQVVWDKGLVDPSDTCAHLLNNPSDAISHFFPELK